MPAIVYFLHCSREMRTGESDMCIQQIRRVVVDTREQRPYDYGCEAVRRALPAGDYSVEGLENCVAIERKSLDDWINTVLRGKRRFGKELKLLQSYQFAAVIIEGSLQDITSGDYKSQITPASLFGITAAIMQAYHPVHIIFAGDRAHAAALTLGILNRWRVD
jgi:DNA excision repair protein ERCC-4